MHHFSITEAIIAQKAHNALWSRNPEEQMLSATFLRLGDQLEAQWESNNIQRTLCGLALQTNDMLCDMWNSLGEIQASQERTNELLAKSLAVQTDHFMLDKRERVLKDALFRWSEIFSGVDGPDDPHWVLIASRTLLEFLKTWSFTTEDLQDPAEKRSFLNLVKLAKKSINEARREIVSEVNLFQKLYDELANLRSPEVIASIRAQQFSYPAFKPSLPAEDVSRMVETYLGYTFVSGKAQAFVSTHPGSPPREKITAFFSQVVAEAISTGEQPLLVIYGVASPGTSLWKRLDQILTTNKRQQCLMLTDTAVYLYWTSENPTEPASCRHSFNVCRAGYLEDTSALFNFGGMNLEPAVTNIIVRANTFSAAMKTYWSTTLPPVINQAKTAYDEKLDNERIRWELEKDRAIKDHFQKEQTSIESINDYLHIHTAVQQFYPLVTQSCERT